MANFTIISGDPTTGILTFDAQSNGGNANVARSEQVNWKVDPKATGIDHISGIGPKPNSPNVFSNGPSQNGNSKNWQATVENSTINIAENYNIIWIDTAGVSHPFDPIISVNSPIVKPVVLVQRGTKKKKK